MSIFKTPSPDMPMQPEMRQSMKPDYSMGMPMAMSPAMPSNVKVAQSFDEAEAMLRSACCGDNGARSIEHVSRPRYGHKV